MKMKLRINGKMLLYILGTTFLVYSAALGFISFKLRNTSYENASKILEATANQHSHNAKSLLDYYMESTETLAEAFGNYSLIQEENRRPFLAQMLQDLLQKNPNFLSVWSILEHQSIDGLDSLHINQMGSTVLGNFRHIYYRQGDSIVLSDYIEQDPNEVFSGRIYNQVKTKQQAAVIEPYYYSYTKDKKDSILQTNMVAPVINNDQFIGVVGIDAPLSGIQEAFKNLRPMETGMVFILSNKGHFVAHPETSYLGKNINEAYGQIESTFNLTERISRGEAIEFRAIEPTSGEECLFAFEPIRVGNSHNPWSFGVCIPIETLYAQAANTMSIALLVGLAGLLILSLLLYAISSSISRPIVRITKSLQALSRGNISNKLNVKYLFKDEISEIAFATNNLFDGLNAAAEFARKIGDGNLTAKYHLLSDHDALGNSLIKMQESLIIAREEEKKKQIEDEKRNWVTHGLAKFGEIIRQDNDNMEKFSQNVIKNLAEYVDAAQVAIYINRKDEFQESEQDVFELKAAQAYGNPVMINKEVESGHELLGRAADENKYIYLTGIPENYVELSPGMSTDARPRNLLISPMSINEDVYGLFEIISYNKFDPHHIEFIQKLSENVASIISSVKTNIRTAALLEQSREQADELAQHEEEMRQNLEEMQATQEEAAHRHDNLTSYIKAIKGNMMVAEMDIQGRIIDASPELTVVLGSSIENMRNKFYDAFIAQDEKTRGEFAYFWEKLVKSGSGKRLQKLSHRNKEVWLLESYFVIEKEDLRPKVLLICVDKTKEVELNQVLKAELNQ